MANAPPLRVAITGAAGYVGHRLLQRLAQEPAIESVIATDVRPLDEVPLKVTFHRQDILEPLDGLFQRHGVQALVHLAFVLRPGRDREAVRRVNVGGTRNALLASRAAGVRRMVYLSSTTVYGPHPDNPVPLDEASPVRPPAGFQYAEDKVASEALLQAYAQEDRESRVSILRGCVVMGPGASNFVTQALFKPVLIGVRGHDPPMQFLHEDDLTDLLVRFLLEEHPGVFNVAGPGEVPYSRMVRLARRPLVWLPAPIAYALTELTWRLRLQSDSPSVGLDFIRYPWVASTEKVERETDFRLQYTSEEALRSFLESPKK